MVQGSARKMVGVVIGASHGREEGDRAKESSVRGSPTVSFYQLRHVTSSKAVSISQAGRIRAAPRYPPLSVGGRTRGL